MDRSKFEHEVLKRMKKMNNGNTDIQFLSWENGESKASIGNCELEPYTLLVFYANDLMKRCCGRIADRKVDMCSDVLLVDAKKMRVIIDRRIENGEFIFVENGDQCNTYTAEVSEANGKEYGKIFVLYEDNEICQLILFDSMLHKKNLL